ncbi:MAG: hypothetical protein GX974_05505 [Clostridiales bacterium]|nr:hypothetical protein [Clostridiales bacterium]
MLTFFGQKRGIIYLVALAILLPVLVISYGYFKYIPRKIEQHDEMEHIMEHIIEVDRETEAVHEGYKTLTDSKTIIYKNYNYKACGHSHMIEETISYEDIGLDEEKFSNKYPAWTLDEFGSDIIIMKRTLDGYCPKHFILKDLDGMITIYKPDTDGNLGIIKQTDIAIEYLPYELQTWMQNGLAVDSLQDIENMIEDLDS